MKSSVRARPVTIAWLAVIAAGIAGYAGIVAPGEREVRSISADAAGLYQLAARNERMLKKSEAIAQAAKRVRRDLATLSAQSGAGSSTLQVLAFLDAASKRANVAFGGIVPSERAGQDSAAQRVTLSLSGAYRDVLGVVSELTTHGTVVGVESVSLTRDAQSGAAPLVDAAVSATIYYGTRAFTHVTDGEDAGHVPSTGR